MCQSVEKINVKWHISYLLMDLEYPLSEAQGVQRRKIEVVSCDDGFLYPALHKTDSQSDIFRSS